MKKSKHSKRELKNLNEDKMQNQSQQEKESPIGSDYAEHVEQVLEEAKAEEPVPKKKSRPKTLPLHRRPVHLRKKLTEMTPEELKEYYKLRDEYLEEWEREQVVEFVEYKPETFILISHFISGFLGKRFGEKWAFNEEEHKAFCEAIAPLANKYMRFASKYQEELRFSIFVLTYIGNRV